MRRIAMVVTAILFTTFGLAAPASAVASGSLTPRSGSVVVTYSDPGAGKFAVVNVCPASMSRADCNGSNRTYYLTTQASLGSTLGASPYTIQEGTAVRASPSDILTTLPAGTYRMRLFVDTADAASEVVTIGSGASSSDTSMTPPSIIQQFGKSSVGTCDDAEPDGLNWGGAASGGWGASWSQWMNGGLGGAVCTRTLVYNIALGQWVVG